MSEFKYLVKNAGLRDAVLYQFYKLGLKFHQSRPLVNYRKNKGEWLENIYAHLFVSQQKAARINGKDLCEVPVGENGVVYLRPLSSDRDVFNQVFGLEDYSVVKEIYKQLFAGEPKLIIDLGANIGLTSVYFSKSYDTAVIHAVEPFEDNAGMAELNMQRNHVKDFRVIKGGIWSHNCTLSLDKEFRDGKEWSIRLNEDTGGNIKGICLDEMLSSYNQPIDILKMDIEGTEKILFADPMYAGSFLKKIKCLAIEIHDEFDCRESIYAALASNGFFYYNVRDLTIAINRNYL